MLIFRGVYLNNVFYKQATKPAKHDSPEFRWLLRMFVMAQEPGWHWHSPTGYWFMLKNTHFCVICMAHVSLIPLAPLSWSWDFTCNPLNRTHCRLEFTVPTRHQRLPCLCFLTNPYREVPVVFVNPGIHMERQFCSAHLSKAIIFWYRRNVNEFVWFW